MVEKTNITKKQNSSVKSVKAKAVSVQRQRSAQPRKQRKAIYTADLHQKQKYLHVPLSKDLRARHAKKNVQVRKGDTVKIMRGQYKRKQGKVETVDLKRSRILIEGAHKEKRDGMKSYYPIHPSNVQIISLELSDKKRKEKLMVKKKNTSVGTTTKTPATNIKNEIKK